MVGVGQRVTDGEGGGRSKTKEEQTTLSNSKQMIPKLAVQNSRVFDQNGVSLLYIMLEIHLSGREPSKCVLLYTHALYSGCCHVITLTRDMVVNN